MNVAFDVAPLVLDNAGTARYVRGGSARCAAETMSKCRR